MKSEKNPAGRRKNRSVLEKYNGSKLGWLHDVIFLVLAVAVIICIFRFCIGFSLVGGDVVDLDNE